MEIILVGLEPLEDQPVLSGNRNRCLRSQSYRANCDAQCGDHVQGYTAASLERSRTVRNEYRTKGMLYVTECMAKGALRLIEEPELLTEAWRVHQE